MSVATDNLLRRHRISVDQYYRMAEVGLLPHDARVELIEGEVIDMAPIGARHAAIVDWLAQGFAGQAGERATIGSQRPLRLDSATEPQPDVLVLEPRADNYSGAHPTAADVLLIVEVSDSTAAYDRKIKAPLYAKHGIPELWLIDVNTKQLLVLRDPRPDDYASIAVFVGGTISIGKLPAVTVSVPRLLELMA